MEQQSVMLGLWSPDLAAIPSQTGRTSEEQDSFSEGLRKITGLHELYRCRGQKAHLW